MTDDDIAEAARTIALRCGRRHAEASDYRAVAKALTQELAAARAALLDAIDYIEQDSSDEATEVLMDLRACLADEVKP